jgi:hypothetical protein
MNLKLSTVLALIVGGAFPAASILAMRGGNENVVPEGPEFARDLAIEHILKNHVEHKGLLAPSSWAARNLTPERLVGSNTWQYKSGGWTVTTTNMVVRIPTYSVEIEYEGDTGFLWKGTVDQDGNVVETAFTLAQ